MTSLDKAQQSYDDMEPDDDEETDQEDDQDFDDYPEPDEQASFERSP